VFVGVLALALSVTVGISVNAEAKKKKKAPKVVKFTETKQVNALVPDALAVAPNTWGRLKSSITVPDTFRKRFIGDVNITVETTGGVAGAAGDLIFRLTSPTGRTVQLVGNIGDQSIGPFKMDDDTATTICNAATPPCADPDAILNRPFAGTAQPFGQLSSFDGVRMKGNWTLAVLDDTATKTSTLKAWTLDVKSQKTK
jgi:subtilisin-like proprotein convertase family protein